MRKQSLIYILTGLFIIPTLEGYTQDFNTTFYSKKSITLTVPQVDRPLVGMQKVEKEQSPYPDQIAYDEVRLYDYPLPALTSAVTPLQMSYEGFQTVRSNYIKAGMGNYITPYAEGFFNSRYGESVDYGVRVKHLSSQTGAIGTTHSANSYNHISLFGNMYLNDSRTASGQVSEAKADKLGGRMSYDRWGQHYYGFDLPIEEVDPDSTRQVYHLLAMEGSYLLDRKQWFIKPKVNAYYWADKYEASELGLSVGADGRYRLGEAQYINGLLDAVLNKTTQQEVARNRNRVHLEGNYNISIDQLRVKVGGKFAYSADSSQLDQNIYLYPDVYVHYTLPNNMWGVFLKVDGGLETVNMKRLTAENHFIGQGQELLHQSKLVDAALGLTATVRQNLSLNAAVGYGIYNNMHFFVNDSVDVSRFNVLYASEEATGVFHTNIELSGRVGNIRGGVSSEVNVYNLGEQFEEAWHKPLLTNKVNLGYSYLDKFDFEVTLLNYAGIKARTIGEDGFTQVETLPMIFDMGITSDYNVNEKLGIFLKLQNLFGSNYQRYWRYEERGIQFLLGASYSF
ncbi:hypothetical protein [Algivirga pacifica]|uniref:TonB-dependent receptor n=1 Tax=Algivirga pacifica TaxID=1162670 RepID=A0ABP9D8J6_9BACT